MYRQIALNLGKGFEMKAWQDFVERTTAQIQNTLYLQQELSAVGKRT